MSATKELAALTYGMFVFCEAAEMMIDEIIEDPKREGLYGEQKRHYNNMVSGIKKALMGYNGFNTAFETMYHKLGAPLKTDEIRRDANDLIRYFCYARNSISSPPQQEEFENTLKSMQTPNEIVIKQETIDRFRLKL